VSIRNQAQKLFHPNYIGHNDVIEQQDGNGPFSLKKDSLWLSLLNLIFDQSFARIFRSDPVHGMLSYATVLGAVATFYLFPGHYLAIWKRRLGGDTLTLLTSPELEARRMEREIKSKIRQLRERSFLVAANEVERQSYMLELPKSRIEIASARVKSDNFIRLLNKVEAANLVRPVSYRCSFLNDISHCSRLTLSLFCFNAFMCSLAIIFFIILFDILRVVEKAWPNYEIDYNESSDELFPRLPSRNTAYLSTNSSDGQIPNGHLVQRESNRATPTDRSLLDYYQLMVTNKNFRDRFFFISKKAVAVHAKAIMELCFCAIILAAMFGFWLQLLMLTLVHHLNWTWQISNQLKICCQISRMLGRLKIKKELIENQTPNEKESPADYSFDNYLLRVQTGQLEAQLCEYLLISYINYQLFRNHHNTLNQLANFGVSQSAMIAIANIISIYFVIGNLKVAVDGLTLAATFLVLVLVNIFIMLICIWTKSSESLTRITIDLMNSLAEIQSMRLSMSCPVILWRRLFLSEDLLKQLASPRILGMIRMSFEKCIAANIYLVAYWLLLVRIIR